jgi:prophage regulatory protein
MSQRILRIEAASEKVGLPKSSIYELMRAGRFPKAVPLSERRTGFVEKEIDEWIAARVAERDAK